MDDKSEAKTKKLSIHMHAYSFLKDYSDKIFSLNLNQKVNYLWKDKENHLVRKTDKKARFSF